MTEKTPTPVNIVPFDTLDEGIEMRFRGVERDEEGAPIGEMLDIMLTVPPLNFYNLKRLEKSFQSIPEAATVVSMEKMADILAPALAQNYKGVPRWLVEQSIKVDNLGDIMGALMDLSGLKRKEVAEKKVRAAMPPEPTGIPSTAT